MLRCFSEQEKIKVDLFIQMGVNCWIRHLLNANVVTKQTFYSMPNKTGSDF